MEVKCSPDERDCSIKGSCIRGFTTSGPVQDEVGLVICTGSVRECQAVEVLTKQPVYCMKC